MRQMRKRKNYRTEAEELWSASRLSDFLGVSVRTINRWRQDKLIPFVVLPSGTFRYDPQKVEDCLVAKDYQAA